MNIIKTRDYPPNIDKKPDIEKLKKILLPKVQGSGERNRNL